MAQVRSARAINRAEKNEGSNIFITSLGTNKDGKI